MKTFLKITILATALVGAALSLNHQPSHSQTVPVKSSCCDGPPLCPDPLNPLCPGGF